MDEEEEAPEDASADCECDHCSPVVTTTLTVSVLVGGFLVVFQEASDPTSMALKIGASGCAGAAALSCWLCHFVDPGTPQPDASDPPPADEQDDSVRIRERHLPGGEAWQQKWCRQCKLWRPYRCGHCSMCKRCVMRLDHHCVWMGTCIGERNLRFFTAFLVFMSAAMLLLIALAVHRAALLRCWIDPRRLFDTWEPFGMLLFLGCCPPCAPILCTGPILGFVSGWDSFLALSDVDEERCGHDCWGEAHKARSCRGVKIYCLGPLAAKTAVRPGQVPDEEAAPAA